MRFIGLDVGSVSVKLVVFDEKVNKLYSSYKRHKGHPISVTFELLKTVMRDAFCVMRNENPELVRNSSLQTSHFSLSITGSAGRLIASILGIESVNEIVAQAYSTQKLFPHIKTIIEMGGEDSKLIILDQDSRSIRDFSMNSVCAAGTGSFLDQQAERLRLTIEEFSELALRSNKPSRIAGRCSVFAKSDMIHLQQIATPVEDIVAGLCFAVARNFKGSISRGRKIRPPVSFQGGVAANKGMVRAFKEIFELDELFVPEEYAFMGAIGAVFKNMHEDTIQHFDLSRLEDFLRTERPVEAGHPPLNDQFQLIVNGQLSIVKTNDQWPMTNDQHIDSSLINCYSSQKIKTYLGIDIGSISTNLAVIDEHGRLLSKRYLMTAGRPIEAVRQGFAEIGEEIGDKVEIVGVGTTGSGRYMIADYVGADIVKNEITAHATAAVFIDKTVDTVFEIGGQDSKYISLKDGVVVDFEMNKACAAGTGSFLEEQAEKLNISIKGEFAQSALSSKNPSRLGERCTVFMENSLMANLQKGIDKNDLLAGLAYSIVQNYINRVVAGKHIGENIVFLGGVAFNKAVMAAFERYLGKRIIVPLHHEVAGAIGMALIAMRYMRNGESDIQRLGETEIQEGHHVTESPFHRITVFKGFELSKRPYEISSFECKGCPNSCEINRVKITGEEGFLFYGGRCDKYDVKKKAVNSEQLAVSKKHADLFSFRDEMLWKEHTFRRTQRYGDTENRRNGEDKDTSPCHRVTVSPRQMKIGLPYIFFFHDYLPFWTTLLWELGFDVEVSPKTNRQIVNLGLESVLSETCFPIKVAHGHVKYLLDKKVDALLLPSFINLNTPENPFDRGYACPYTQTIPYISKIAFEGIKLLTPIVSLRRGRDFLEKEIRRVLRPLGVKSKDVPRALETSERKQKEFLEDIKLTSEEVLSSLKEKTIVIVGRAYNAFDSGVNLEIPKKLADLGVHSIPMDFLPIEEINIYQDWPNMYWRSGQRILQAAKLIRNHPNLYAIYIGNFSCGPDSFILKYFDKEMKGKPYLFLEIDEHSAAAGAITRCEAFIDSIGNQGSGVIRKRQKKSEEKTPHASLVTRHSKRTLYIPRMSDHAFALAAAFERCGIESEVLPESDKKSADIGKKYVSGRECYPCTVTTGDMVKKVMEPNFMPSKSAFFMPSATGPCRFGQYNVFQRLVLDKMGYDDVPIFAPNQDTTFYSDLGIVGKDFTKNAWKGILAYELLNKCLHETRPYEKDKGSADELYDEYLRRLYFSLKRNNTDLEDILKDIRRDFENLPVYKDKKPLIGIIGEIFVRCHRFSNEDLIRKVESLGGEVWLAPVEEWIYYVNFMGFKKACFKKEKSAVISFLLKRFYQKRVEHRYARHFEGFLKTLKEPDTKEILKK
ncbi:MAG TPA: acyl-CoA dehydratase activase, partial [Thermodesulfovibrionales bacterium]|nr:acyl-CoA dehydratase activase [Thermodesulfovibrionales bacterium]